ncbi:right-handed parallel beta-helix repeat-containing protein [Diaminobutyricimonas sp. LJ205]|uniref:right-handed parallel beta-helix repeat-containing protein n=1 Tax=Diaminobutyricimonas sp. LJ205 TaxID=2683590 RepID=UPI0012F4CF96|nr:right-handed parallel beta-helix repeat-containing protein [Diaminobutyricimonas sp. LJ205]
MFGRSDAEGGWTRRMVLSGSVAGLIGVPLSSIPRELSAANSAVLLNSQKYVRNRDLVIDAVAEGADNSGATDARLAILAAIGLVPTAGAVVRLRKGSYKLSSRLILNKPGIVLEGEGPATILLPDVAAFQVGADNITIRNMTVRGGVAGTQGAFQSLTSGAFKHWHFENVIFENLAVTLRRIGAIQSTGAAFTSGAGFDSHVTFENCAFSGFKGDGMLNIGGVDHVTINNSWFHDSGVDFNRGDMLKLSSGTQYWNVTHNRFERGTRDAIDCYDGHRGLIEGNTIVDMGVHGVEMKVASNSAPNPADRNLVLGNHIVNIGIRSSCPGIQCATSNAIIANNLLEGGGGMETGIRIGKVTDGSANTHDNIVMGNRVIGANGYGIAALGCDGIVIQGNVVTGSGSSGFHVSPSKNTFIAGSAAMNVSRSNGVADVWT